MNERPRSDQPLLAVLIDADNVSATRCEALFAEVATLGVATVKRVYGDWTSDTLKSWKESVNEHAIQPIQQFANTKGKNATDSALIIDAMDLLYTDRLDGFCLVSSDSDFTRLASRLRESGLTVYGFGERKTPKALVSAVDRFIYLELLSAPTSDTPDAPPRDQWTRARLREDTRLVQLLYAGVDAAAADDGWAHLGGVGSTMRKQQPDFDVREYGYPRLSDLVLTIDLFEVGEGGNGLRLRRRRGTKKAAPKAPGKAAPGKKASSAEPG